MATDEELSRRPSNAGQVVQPYAAGNDPFPGILHEIPTVKNSDKFIFVFRRFTGAPTSRLDIEQGFSNVVFALPKNPTAQTRKQDKNITFHLTSGGYVAMNWGNGLIEMTFTGSTGRLIIEDNIPEADLVNLQLARAYPSSPFNNFLLGTTGNVQDSKYPTNIRETSAWKVFSKFNYFYQYFNGGNEVAFEPGSLATRSLMATPRTSHIILMFFDRVYVGVMTKFSYDVDANDPWQIKYSFSFTSFPILETPGARTPLNAITIAAEEPPRLAAGSALDLALPSTQFLGTSFGDI